MKIHKSFPKSIVTGILILVVAVSMVIVLGNHKAFATTDSCTPPSTTYGTDTLSLSVPSAGTYTIWTRMEIPSSTANSILLNINNGSSCYDVGGSTSIPTGSWQWIDYNDGNTANVIEASLNQGANTLKLTGTSGGVAIDLIEALSGTSCTPTGTGTNCAPTTLAAPTVSLTSPASDATVSGTTVTLSANAASAPGVSEVGLSKVVFEVNGQVVGTATASPYSINWNSTSISNGTYTLEAIATDTQGQSTAASETITVANNLCTANPSTPTGLTGSSASSTQVSLSWTASTPASGCTINDYTIYQNGTNIGTSVTTSFLVNDLTPDTTYSYTVSANDNSGHSSAKSAATSITTQADKTPPTIPGAVTAKAPNSSQVDLSWTASTDSLGVAGYKIYRNSTLLGTVNSATAISYQDNTVAPDTAYTYQISAFDSAGNVSALAKAQPAPITTPAAATVAVAPSAPTNLKATLVTDNSIVITWTASTDSSGKVAGYRVYRDDRLVSTVTNGTSYTDSGLRLQTTYSYYIVAYNTSDQRSNKSSTLSVTTESNYHRAYNHKRRY